MTQTHAGSNESLRPSRQCGTMAFFLALMLGGYAMAKSPKVLESVKDPILSEETRVTHQGPWTVVDNQRKDSIWIYDESGALTNIINLVGQEYIGTVSSVDNAGNCLVQRSSSDDLVLLYFDAEGQLKWRKQTEYGPGSGFKLSPDGRHFVRASGNWGEFEIYRTASPQVKIEYGPKDIPAGANYFADFAADNSLILFILPGTLLKLDPATGTAMASVKLAAAKGKEFRRSYDTDYANQAADKERTHFASIVNNGPGWDVDQSEMSILVYDQNLNSTVIPTGSYIQDVEFIDSLLVFTVFNRKKQNFNVRVSRDYRSAEIMSHESSSDIGMAANEDGILHFWPSKDKEFWFDLASQKIVQGAKGKMWLFKKGPGRKEAKALPIGKVGQN